MRKGLVCLALAFCVCRTAVAVARARDLTIEERVTAQKAIEQVYWSHRTWPRENPQPKPALAAVMSDSAIRAKVEDYLAKSAALEAIWASPIRSFELQAEMERMAKQTRNPEVLGELFLALRDDPAVIGECLARRHM